MAARPATRPVLDQPLLDAAQQRVARDPRTATDPPRRRQVGGDPRIADAPHEIAQVARTAHAHGHCRSRSSGGGRAQTSAAGGGGRGPRACTACARGTSDGSSVAETWAGDTGDVEHQQPGLRLGLLLLGVLATLWGASYSFIKLGVETIPPLTLIAARTLIAGTLLLGVLVLRGQRLPMRPALWRRFLVQACLNSVVPFTLIAWAELTVDAGLATILNSTSPIFAFVLTAAVTRHEPATGRKLLGVVAGMAGICLIVGVSALQGLGEAITAQLAIVAATICYAGAAVFGRGFQGLDPVLPAAGSMLCGAAILIPVSLVVDRPWTLEPSAVSLLALLALAAFSTALAFVIYFRLVQTLGSVGTTAQAYLRVPVGVAIGVVFLGETPTAIAWIGLVCVVTGAAAMTIPRSAAQRSRPIGDRLFPKRPTP
jgi:drug/metabolite transporter (DMT)-like permease